MKWTDRDLALARAACQLRAARPNEWDEFTRAIHAYSASVRDAFLTAPQTDLPLIQGQARACHVLAELLENAPRIVNEARVRNQK